jgi:hypothetical protein
LWSGRAVAFVITAAVATASVTISAAATTSATFAVEKLHIFTNDADFSALLPSGFVFPRIHLKAAFDKNGFASGKVLPGELGLLAPQDHVQVGDFFLPFPGIVDVTPVHGDCHITHRSSFGRETHLRIAGEVANEHDFIERGHRPHLSQFTASTATILSFLPQDDFLIIR